MATFVPDRPRFATRGEGRLIHTLRKLPDDYTVYYEPSVAGLRPDIVIVGPDLGVVVLEVKDYTKSSILSISNNEWTLNINGQVVNHKCPLSQARRYSFAIADVLKKDSQLVAHEGIYLGKLKFPYAYGVVFTRLNQEDLIKGNYYSILPAHQVLTRDEIEEDNPEFTIEHLISKLQEMKGNVFTRWEPLNEQDIKHIRFLLFPEIRIAATTTEYQVAESMPQYEEKVLLSLRDVKVMDLHQENLAKVMGEGHRLLRGVAGSGKTLILSCRAKYLAKTNPGWRILVLCYNVTLSRYIQHVIDSLEIEAENESKIEVCNFHFWAARHLGIKGAAGDIPEEELLRICQGIGQGKIKGPQYDAILIDEGQDFEPSWLRLVLSTLKPETGSLLLVEDRAQEIYRRKSFSQELGLSFRGRSRILTINYRNTEQIVQFAWDMYEHFNPAKRSARNEEIVEIIPPRSTRRKGPSPLVKKTGSFADEARLIASEIKRLHDTENIDYSQIAVFYRVKKMSIPYVQLLTNTFKKQGIPHYWLSENYESKRLFDRNESTVKISTVESAKGLEFRVVFVCNLDNFPLLIGDNDVQHEARLLYIAMTRAMERLYMSYSGESVFTEYLEEMGRFR